MISLAKQDGVITIVIMQEKNDIMSACMALSRMILYAHLRGKHGISRGSLMWVRGIYESPREVHLVSSQVCIRCRLAATARDPAARDDNDHG